MVAQSLTHIAFDATGAAVTTVGGELVVDAASGVLGQAKNAAFATSRQI